ncbi:MAG: hypothetical protein J4G10_04220 [Alphaproteobacteria bacterium]|nr:hypothetical protein [Alphaproteobacteria bacterium]
MAKRIGRTVGMAAAMTLPFLAAGCALPPAVTVASLAADGMSYAVSGRAVSDHAISFAAQEDCALYRAVQGESICRAEEGTEQTRAFEGAAAPINLVETPAASEESVTPPVETVSPSQPEAPEEKEEIAALGPPMPAERRWVYPGAPGVTATFLALGSYRFRTNAVQVAERYAAHSPYIVSVFLNGERYYRVVAGPYEETEIEAARTRLEAAGVAHPWRVQLCGVEGVGLNCEKAG